MFFTQLGILYKLSPTFFTLVHPLVLLFPAGYQGGSSTAKEYDDQSHAHCAVLSSKKQGRNSQQRAVVYTSAQEADHWFSSLNFPGCGDGSQDRPCK